MSTEVGGDDIEGDRSVSVERVCFLCQKNIYMWTSKLDPIKITQQKLALCKLFSAPMYSLHYVNFMGENDPHFFCFNCEPVLKTLETTFKEQEEVDRKLTSIKEEMALIYNPDKAAGQDDLLHQQLSEIRRKLRRSKGKSNQNQDSSTNKTSETSTSQHAPHKPTIVKIERTEDLMNNISRTNHREENLPNIPNTNATSITTSTITTGTSVSNSAPPNASQVIIDPVSTIPAELPSTNQHLDGLERIISQNDIVLPPSPPLVECNSSTTSTNGIIVHDSTDHESADDNAVSALEEMKRQLESLHNSNSSSGQGTSLSIGHNTNGVPIVIQSHSLSTSTLNDQQQQQVQLPTRMETEDVESSEEQSSSNSHIESTDNRNSTGKSHIPYRSASSTWLKEVVQQPSPYIPQLEDELIYFRQGHEKYVKKVQQQNLYKMSKEFIKQIPYEADPSLSAELRVKIINIEYLIMPPQVVSLELQILSWGSGIPTGKKVNVIYHDMADVLDFLILKQMYDSSLTQTWYVGDRFRYFVSPFWYIGEIVSNKPFDEKFPESNFLRYLTKYWKSNDNLKEYMSPWEMEIIPADFESVIQKYDGNGVPSFSITNFDKQKRKNFYKINNLDWPFDRDTECGRISQLLKRLIELPICDPFKHPVDLNLYPDYAIKVAYPIDVSTIKNRVENHFYRRLTSLQNDIKFLARNAKIYNHPKSEIVLHSKIIRNVCLEITNNRDLLQLLDVDKLLEKLCQKCYTGDYYISNFSDGIRSSSSRRLTKRKKSIEIDESKPWDENAKSLLDNLFEAKESTLFLEPVDLTIFPRYIELIRKPMDLQTVRNNLNSGKYETPIEFSKDIKLIYYNSRSFNTNKKSSIYEITTKFKSLYRDKLQEIIDIWAKKRKRSKSSDKNSSNAVTNPA